MSWVYHDHDPDIMVTLTGDDQLHCIRVRIGEVQLLLHTRSAVDLHQKLGKALLDWIRESCEQLLGADVELLAKMKGWQHRE